MFLQISTTFAKKSDAEKFARTLLEKKFAACVQVVGPITSTYLWKGKVARSREYFCLIKTTKSGYQKVEKCIKQNHPYELPEIIATPIVAGSAEYLGWIRQCIM